ncbi:MAG: HAMP domain-containing histidine kinase [Desulfobacterales bacterium]|nr:HAMP domain-containing histidine kinase [Desulfobacterales bacterium]
MAFLQDDSLQAVKMEIEDPHSPHLTFEQRKRIYTRHLQGAFVRTGAIFGVWLFLALSYWYDAITTLSFIGLSITGAVVIVSNIPFLLGLQKISRRSTFEYYNLIINFIEAVGDTVIIYFLGGIKGMYLIIIYAGLIAYVGIVAPRRYPFIMATICAGSFAVMALLEHFGVIPHQNNQWGYPYSFTEVILIIFCLTVTLYVLAFILSYTARVLKRAKDELMRQNAALFQSRRELNSIADEMQQKNEALEKSMEELRQAQTQLVESEKLAALGGLVAGVAHEINTPVGVGVTAISFLQEKTKKIIELNTTDALTKELFENYLHSANEAAATIYTNLKRAAELVRNFKQVAVDQSSETRRMFNVKEYIEGTLLSLLFQYRRSGHTVTVNCPDNLVIDSYPGVFAQIITNLLMNSLAHGFEDMTGGEIVIEVKHSSNFLHFRFSDNGKGMAPETGKRIFEPFFTTKRGDGGSGLGMHIVYNAVTRTLKGKILCTSAPGAGCTFDILIPMNPAGHTSTTEHLSAR